MKSQDLLHKIKEIKKKANMLLYKIDKARKLENNPQTNPAVEKLIDENNQTIIEQLKIIDELVQINKLFSEELRNDNEYLSEMDYDSYLVLTQNGEINFDKNHPYFKDIRFIKDLMQYYIDTEQYEKCSYLQSII